MSDLPEPTLALSPEQIAFYNENGYLAIDSITTDDEILSMCAAYDAVEFDLDRSSLILAEISVAARMNADDFSV